MWRKTISHLCEVHEYQDARLLGIELKCKSAPVLLVNVYLPYDCCDNAEEFHYYISRLSSIICDFSSPYVYIIGYFNSDINVLNGQAVKPFGRDFLTFCDDENLAICDKLWLNDTGAYTYVSDAHRTTSWLDHCITTLNGYAIIKKCVILYDFVTSDHKPLTVCLSMKDITFVTCDESLKKSSGSVKWSELKHEQLDEYRCNTKEALAKVDIDMEVLRCTDVNCINNHHRSKIDELYNNVADSLSRCSNVLLKKFKPHKAVPGWNDYCKLAHESARDAFLMWRSQGSPRYGPIFDNMSKTRAYFKRCLRKCKANENNCKTDALARKLLCRNSCDFWKDVKKLSGDKGMLLSDKIDGVTGQENIANTWYNHYNHLLISNDVKTGQNDVIRALHNCSQDDLVTFTVEEVKESINSLKTGKSSGKDKIQAEHLKNADDRVFVLLTLLFNACISHGYS